LPADCIQSDEVLNPLQNVIDPQYMVDLRLMLRLAIAGKSNAAKVATIEASMRPHSLKEVASLEKHLKDALSKLADDRKRLEKKKG
jgi:replication-associated recombination protein RarA